MLREHRPESPAVPDQLARLQAAPPLKTVRETVPVVVERAIVRALAKVPADRFETAAKFMEALAAHTGPSQRLRWRLPIIAAACLALAGLVVANLLGRHHSKVTPSASVIAVIPLDHEGGG